MKLTSPVFENEGKIPSVYTCDGKNVSPPLAIEDVPIEAKSLALIMDDPDVPAHIREDGMFDHWVLWNIPIDTKVIKEGEVIGVTGSNTAGSVKYTGPCPPDREHRYFFKLYALDTELDLAEGSTKAMVEKAMEGHIIEQCELMGRYDRS